MTPGSSKMSPVCLPPIGPTHFGDPSGSKMTPRVSKVTPGVPKVTPPGAQSDPRGAQSDPRSAQSDPPGTPTPQKGGLLGRQSESKTSFTTPFCIFLATLSLRLCFLPPPGATDPPTHQHFYPTTHRHHFSSTPGRRNARSD